MMRQTVTRLSLAWCLIAIHPAFADDEIKKDPNLQFPNEIVTVKREDYSIAGLVTHLDTTKKYQHAIALFAGHPGMLKLHEENGQPKYELSGNFLIRSRRHWLDDETLVVSVDAPSDQWSTFSQSFRTSPRYGGDVNALLMEISHKYQVKDWTAVGTSEGSVSALHIARMNPTLINRIILTSSVAQSNPKGPGLTGVKWEEILMPLLWVHHYSDLCQYTPYRDAQSFAEMSHKPLLTVRGGGPIRGDSCKAFSYHGFAGAERETIAAMKAWILSGKTSTEINVESRAN